MDFLPENEEPKKKKKGFNSYWLFAILIIGLFATQFLSLNFQIKPTSEDEFFRKMVPSGDVAKINIVNKEQIEVFIKEDSLKQKKQYAEIKQNRMGSINKGPHYSFQITSVDGFKTKLDNIQQNIPYEKLIKVNNEYRKGILDIIGWLLPIILLIAVWMFLMRRATGGMGGGPGGQIFNIGKSKANLYDKDMKVNVTFDDVAGLDEAKEEVKEVVDFLKNPKKYTALGAKIPKGVLLVGPPGTGKTLLAKAMAGEAQVPFFSISGSDFVEMFVGVGASRVRDLFKQAREKAPCIIFIDEIDAVGRARGKNMMQSNDERESTLNQLLVEMDGFSGDKGIIMLAATNRPDVLDSALLRPGRFDRQISIDKPDQKGREQIFKVHLKKLTKLGENVTPEKLASLTPGFAGAEIANVCNEAALVAARKEKTQVEVEDFNEAIDRSIGGLEKKNKIISPQEKEIIAFHEAGHAICGWYLEHAHPLLKVTIIPRGIAALGYAQYLPKEQYLYRTEQLMDEICMTLGGRAAEEIIFGKISTGAQNDLQRITQLAYAMVTVYGMNERIGNVSFYDPQQDTTFTKPYSDDTATAIDEEVRKLIDKAYKRTLDLLTERRGELEKIARALLEKEILFKSDLEELIGKRTFDEEPLPVSISID
ncbi:MAG TPA: ATP-dependent zinc metalloprotease FtsH [Chitinophagales bacterium]|nr:ATP-dependent zinc metalloprotease FtsH [Chitinophagales bacterium]HQO88461.1 ATP-dependent zinc metalloprotease FtsH [Chitinophagales bacterium]